ncbi:MAG: anthranilate synthase component I family protein [Bacteroidales bacterium]|nr:anthranilate synthase component I family protein [Bacteroidales bacterium]
MLKQIQIKIDNIIKFKQKALAFGCNYEHFVFLDSCDFTNKNTLHSHYEYDFICAFDSKEEIKLSAKNNFEQLKKFKDSNNWLFGYLAYDLKNELEDLSSNNIDELEFPDIHFFIPKIVISSKNKIVTVNYQSDIDKEYVHQIIEKINTFSIPDFEKSKDGIHLNHRLSKQEYIETVNKLKKHIQLGDIYEINFCQEFYSKASINPLITYLKLRELSPTPFSCFYKNKHQYLLSASPERFIKKKQNKIISQPIKGTKRRGKTEAEDLSLRNELYLDPKERAENVMIVDLVRNDLSRTAKKGSVKVDELYGVYSFNQVHQLISTVSSEINSDTDIIDVIKEAFPMGSMTGAPKIRAMQLIEQYEKTKRGLYSGAVGFITPDNNFDFNVVIRSILYNALKKHVSFTVGGAITSLANAENEYDECMVKAEAMLEVLK